MRDAVLQASMGLVAPEEVAFGPDGLVTAVVQDVEDGAVLMVAHMNAESLRRTLETGRTWFWSRSRQELWPKGATSGEVQDVVELRADCDADALLVVVRQHGGGACHTGQRSCFHRTVSGDTVTAETVAADGASPAP